MRTPLLVLLALATFAFALPALADQVVWKWVDGNGVTHYSDRPVPGAVRIELNLGARPSSSAASSGAVTPGAQAASAADDAPRAADAPLYRDFEILSPANGETVPNTGGEVTVSVRIAPNPQPGHQLDLYLDGRLVEGFAPNTTSFDLKEVPRGTHRVVATISDARGTRIQETAPVEFTVRQASIAQPPVGPALRPPPRRPGAANKLPARQPSHAALNGVRPAIDARTNAPVVAGKAGT